MVCSRYPKECRYYETILKKKCLRKFRNNVWERKTKWILIEKANHHRRIKLLREFFNSWIVYLNERFKKKINNRAAELFNEEKLKSKGFAALKGNVERMRISMRICRKKFEQNLKHDCWHRWKHYTQKRAKVREIKLLADRIRKERLRVRCFYLWSFRLREKRSFENAFRKAVAMHKAKLLEKYFNSWKIFIKRKVCKARIEKLALSCHEDRLKEKYIRCWKRYTVQKKRYEYHVRVIHEFYESYLIKNYIDRWAIAHEKLKLERKIQKRNMADGFRNRKLLEKSFRFLWKILERKREREEKVERFRETLERIYLEFYLNLWSEKRRRKVVCNHLENRARQWREDYLRELYLGIISKKYEERLEEREQMANVVKYSNAIVVHRAFRGWLEVTERKFNKRIRSENASAFYFEKLTRRTFDKWREFEQKKRRKNMAVERYKNALLLKAVTEWRNFLTEQKTKYLEAKNLERRISERLLRNAFGLWRDEVKSYNRKFEMAASFHEKSKLSRAFTTWRKNSRMKAAHKNRYNKNRIALNSIIIKSVLVRWSEVHSAKLSLKRKLEGFKLRLEKSSVSRHFGVWHGFAEKMKSLRERAVGFPAIRSNVLIEECLLNLSEAVKEKKILRRKNELARKGEEKMLKRRYLRKWLSFICWKKERVLRCMAEERKNDVRTTFEFSVPVVGKIPRRQPIIPDFLKIDFNTDAFEERVTQETFRVERPVNKKLPLVLDQSDSSFSFDI